MSRPSFQPLSDDEISSLFDELSENGFVTRDNVEIKLHTIALDSDPRLSTYHLHMQTASLDDIDLGGFLNSIFPDHTNALDWAEFSELAKQWNVPTQSLARQTNRRSSPKESTLSGKGQLKAYVALEAPRIIFMGIVVILQFSFAMANFIRFMKDQQARHALGWGVIIAKTAAGAIYPTIFFMILSMSRWLATFARKIPGVRQFINWDLYRGFHIYMSCSCLFFASVHAIAHLCGDFVWASRSSHQLAVEQLWGMQWFNTPYDRFLDITPGWTGILAIIIFWIIFGLSLPGVRRRCFEIFQLGHLLVFPLVALLAAHGTMALLQRPMLGYWLFVPVVLVIIERVHRLARGFYQLPASAAILDKDTVTLIVKRRWGRPWRYSAGQYVLLQVPVLSRWQWHPFTVSSCNADQITLHIRTDGNWTKQLRKMADQYFTVGVDGPFGAPAQQIYEFDRTIVVGSGIGVTPMSSIASNFAQQMQRQKDPWRKLRRHQNPFAKIYSPAPSTKSSPLTSLQSSRNASTNSLFRQDQKCAPEIDLEKADFEDKPSSMISKHRRRVDFHWITRDPKSLKWFSDHLNRAQEAAEASSPERPSSTWSPHASTRSSPTPSHDSWFAPSDIAPSVRSQLDLRVNTYITAPSSSLATHVLRHQLDRYRSALQPISALTGLKNDSIFGKPNFTKVLKDFHAELVQQGWVGGEVGVFFCGSPAIGTTLREACRKQAEYARADGSRIKYLFIGEVF